MTQATPSQRTVQTPKGNNVSRVPVESFRIGNVGISIFENESQIESDSHGRLQKYYRAKVDKRYCDAKTGEWRSSNSFSTDELLRLRHLIDRAIDYLSSKPVGDKQH